MILKIARVLGEAEVARCREGLQDAPWADGRVTAGEQSSLAKRNLQLPEDSDAARALGELVLRALACSPLFMSAALPAKVYPPLFNRYGPGMAFGAHIDNAIRTAADGRRYRTDVSGTLFLADPATYDGGELVIGTGDAPPRIKLSAGDLVLYPATTVHRVEPVTRGERLAAFFWVESMVADAGRRDQLYELDRAIAAARQDLGDAHPAAVSLVGAYHNLVRMWCAP